MRTDPFPEFERLQGLIDAVRRFANRALAQKFGALFIVISLAACGNLFGATASDSFCVVARPIQLSDAALNAMNRSDLLQIKGNNDSYARLCPIMAPH